MPFLPEAAPPGPPLNGRRILFITREPIVHQMGGSTTYALGLLELLARNGAAVTLLTTTAKSCSPRLWFRVKAHLPVGVHYVAPGMLRLGALYVGPFSGRAWARLLARLAVRLPLMAPLGSLLRRLYGAALVSDAWDLTTPGEGERSLALDAIRQFHAETVIVNYAFWGPLFQIPELASKQRVILMHDLLSARVTKFLAAGLPLDCARIEEADELAWLNHADCLLAAQQREAEFVQPLVKAMVIVPPLVFSPRASTRAVEPRRCLFVGSNIVPNRTGLAWFLARVWPLVRATDPHAELAVVGTVCATVEQGLPGVLLQGSVPSMQDEYARAAVCIVPLLVGSGIKIKLLEALSYGKATVSTSIGVQGLEDWAAGAIAVTDDAAEFAAAIVRLLHNSDERIRAEQAGLALAQRHFGVQARLPDAFVRGLTGSTPAT